MEDEEEYDDEENEYDADDEEEEVSSTLSKSTLSAVKKSQAKASSSSKAAVNASLKKSPSLHKKKKKTKKASIIRIPYIVRACLNPFTVLAMAKSYFASLFNIAYLEQESSQGLRSALESKAKAEAASGSPPKKGKRAMRPGQAKTLSDLPQLSA